MPDIQRIHANGVDFAYLAEGKGPLVLLLHGFPDTAHTWDQVRPALAARGYRAVSPFLRGYHPSGVAPDGRYDGATLGRDALALVDALGGAPAVLVGHDFGAFAAYAAATLEPRKLRLIVTLAIPHPAVVRPTPSLLWGARHIVRFKLPGAVNALTRDGFAHVDELVRRWSPAWRVPAGETDAVKRGFAEPGRAAIAMAYYQQIPVVLPRELRRRIEVPAVVFAGETDGALRDLDVYDRGRSRFTGAYEVVRMPGGHFLHREHPEQFVTELLRVLAAAPG